MQHDAIWEGNYKIPWDDPDFSRRMLAEHLSQDHDMASRRLEWIDKQVAWIHDDLLGGQPARILDLGCAESTNPLEMATLGFEVHGVDLWPLPVAHPNFSMVRADAARIPYADNSFDVAVCLSTVEHVGLDWYAANPQGASDVKLIAEIVRVLKPGGRFILTVPFGQAAVTPVPE